MPPSLETGRVRDSESTPEGSVSVLTEVTGRDEQPHLPVNHSLPYPGLLLSKCSLGCKPRSCPSFCPFSLTPPAPNYSSSSFCDSPDITLQLRALLLPLNAADCKSPPQEATTCSHMCHHDVQLAVSHVIVMWWTILSISFIYPHLQNVNGHTDLKGFSWGFHG